MRITKIQAPNPKKTVFGFCLLIIGYFSLALFPHALHAQSFYPNLLYRHEHHLFTINPNAHPNWRKTKEVWSYYGAEIVAPQELRVDGDTLPTIPEGMIRSQELVWNEDAIAQTIRTQIADTLNREAGEVTITSTDEGILFEGAGFLGKEVDIERTVRLTIDALEKGVTDIVLPITEKQPILHVLSPELQDRGIAEVVGIGESNFVGSPNARRHNISTGLQRFNGILVPQGSEFSFNEILGPVNATTGYLPELVILGEKTLPEYGGGLCQVSTTAYRGIWEYGFPIAARRNHSFAVQYYAPQGTDATIYPPHTDMKFINDSPSDLLIQTHIEGDKAFFIYYGTRDTREVEILGPYTWNTRPAPPDRIEYTTNLAPGQEKTLGKAVPGFNSAWFRIVRSEDGSEIIEPYYSYYEARPNYTQIGVEPHDVELTPQVKQRLEKRQNALEHS